MCYSLQKVPQGWGRRPCRSPLSTAPSRDFCLPCLAAPLTQGASWRRFPNKFLAPILSPPHWGSHTDGLVLPICLVPGQTSITGLTCSVGAQRFRILPGTALGSHEESSLEQQVPIPKVLSPNLLSWGQWQPLSRQGVKQTLSPPRGPSRASTHGDQRPVPCSARCETPRGTRQFVGTEHFSRIRHRLDAAHGTIPLTLQTTRISFISTL